MKNAGMLEQINLKISLEKVGFWPKKYACLFSCFILGVTRVWT
jgi:hypothetical protein